MTRKKKLAQETDRLLGEMEKLVLQLEAEASEAGALDGLHHLEDKFAATILPRLRALSDDYLRLGPDPNTLAEHVERLLAKKVEFSDSVRAYRDAYEQPPRPSPETTAVKWRRPLTLVSLALIAGLGLVVSGVKVDVVRAGLLAAVTFVLVLNHVQAYSLVRHARDYARYRRAARHHRRLENQISRTENESASEIQRRDWIERWVEGRQDVLINLYRMHRERGEKAASLSSPATA